MIEEDQTPKAASCPQMTLSGHSVEYAVQQVGEGGRQERDSERGWRATSSCAQRRPSLRPERLHGSFVGEDADDVLPWVGRLVFAAVLADEFGDGLAALVGGGAVTRHLHSEFYSVDHLG